MSWIALGVALAAGAVLAAVAVRWWVGPLPTRLPRWAKDEIVSRRIAMERIETVSMEESVAAALWLGSPSRRDGNRVVMEALGSGRTAERPLVSEEDMEAWFRFREAEWSRAKDYLEDARLALATVRWYLGRGHAEAR